MIRDELHSLLTHPFPFYMTIAFLLFYAFDKVHWGFSIVPYALFISVWILSLILRLLAKIWVYLFHRDNPFI
ncbi:MAG: hypothetical protein ACTSXQ_02055 [Alphaproteobacteria bacterium]